MRAIHTVKRVVSLGVIATAGIMTGQRVARPEVPEGVKAPAGEEAILRADAKGVQIYSCQEGSDGKYGWTLKAPKAQLFDEQGKLIGEHFAGPTWRLKDGSEVTGKAAARHDAPEADSIPWLRI